jgi:hypothetical protein
MENYYPDTGCRRATAWIKARCAACGLCPGLKNSRCLECPFPDCLERPVRAQRVRKEYERMPLQRR